jgi:hypothetical protein
MENQARREVEYIAVGDAKFSPHVVLDSAPLRLPKGVDSRTAAASFLLR